MNLLLIKLLSRGLIGHGTAMEIDATLGTPTLNAVLDRFMSPNHAALAASLIGSSNLSDDDTLKLARLFSRSLGVSTAYAAALEFQRLSGGAVSYEGPLDLVPGAVVAYGPRALSSAMRGEALYLIKKLDSGAEPTQSFDADAATGEAPVSAIATFLDGDDGQIMEWNDQSGNGKHIDMTAIEAIWVASMMNSKPGWTSSQGDQGSAATNSSLPNGQATVFLVANNSVELYADNAGQIFDFMTNGDAYLQLSTGANTAGGEIAEQPDQIVLWDAAWEFGTKSLRINGTPKTFVEDYDAVGAVGAISIPFTILSLGLPTRMLEVIVYPTRLSDADRLAVRENIAAHYGIVLS